MNDAAATVVERAGQHVQDAIAVDTQHPWLGLASFTEDTRAYFHGREEEVAELARRVQRKLLTILFGQSGLGKTSLIRAGLVPRLRGDGYCPVYVRVDYSADASSASEQIKHAIYRETLASGQWTQSGVAVQGESLWEFLHHRGDVLQDANGRTLVPLLIFDQFEEVFTIAQSDAAGRERASQFLTDLADLVENRPPAALEARLDEDDSAIERFDFTRADYRILIALREDYLAHLESLKDVMPSITQNRMRLARMTGTQALAAVTKPGGKLVSQEVAEAIVRFTAGGAELRNAEVEPALLSLVCRELNNARIAQGRSEISADVLAGSRDTILAEFYERSLADLPAGVRQVIEDHLLTDSGYRESLAEERFQKLLTAAGAAPGTMARLVDRRLLRVEERLDVRRVELTHDVLTGVVKASRDMRLEREARDEAERKLAMQRERERSTRIALVRTRKIAVGCALLAIVALASAVYGFIATRRAQTAEARAVATRSMAEQARGEAEKLVTYLLDDFQLELAPVGRLDVVGGLAQRALAYYDGLPAQLRTPETERNRALALVRYGLVMRTQSKLEEGRKASDEAVGVLSRLREQGDRSEMTAVGLALALETQARLASSAGQENTATELATRAVETLEPLANTGDASTGLRRAYAQVLTMQGFQQMRNGDARALQTFDRARAAYRSIADLKLDDVAAAVGYAEATAWKVEQYTRVPDFAEAQRATDEALRITDSVLRQRPGNMQALRAEALATTPLAKALRAQGRGTDALAMTHRAERTWREYVRIDPSNSISWSNLAVAYFNEADTLWEMGRLADAAAVHRQALALEREATTRSPFLWNLLAFHASRLAAIEGSRGNVSQANDAVATGMRIVKEFILTRFAPDSYDYQAWSEYGDFARAWAAFGSGDNEGAVAHARAYTTHVEKLTVPGPAARLDHVRGLTVMYQIIAEAGLALGQYPAAEQAVRRTAELRESLTVGSEDSARDAANGGVLRAIILSRMDRNDEARAVLAPALEFHRRFATVESAEYRLELAVALYAAAICGSGDRAALLKQATTLVDSLPSELRAAKPTTLWRERIAGAVRAQGS